MNDCASDILEFGNPLVNAKKPNWINAEDHADTSPAPFLELKSVCIAERHEGTRVVNSLESEAGVLDAFSACQKVCDIASRSVPELKTSSASCKQFAASLFSWALNEPPADIRHPKSLEMEFFDSHCHAFSQFSRGCSCRDSLGF